MKVVLAFLGTLIVGFIAYYGIEAYEQYNLPEYGEVGSFVLTNQDGKKFDAKRELSGKVHIVNFFFTTCKSICPLMTSNINQQIYQKLKDRNDFAVISLSVDPERDSVKVLSDYSRQFGIGKNWDLLTGKKSDIYMLARNDYKLVAGQTGEEEGDFIHSDKMILVDKNAKIRGYYSAIEQDELQRLLKDLNKLF